MGVSPRRAYRVWQRNRDVSLRLWKSELSLALAEPVFVLAVMGWGLGSYVSLASGQSYMAFIAPGIVAAYSMWAAAAECSWGSYMRMEFQKTYDAIIVTPVSIEDVIAGEVAWGTTRAVITATAVLVVVTAFGLISSPLALLIPVVAVVQGAFFSSISIYFTALAPSINTLNYYFTLFLTPMYFFSGVFFPLDRLPEVVQRLAWILPLTPAVDLTRSVMAGHLHWGLVADLVLLVAATGLFFYLGIAAMRRRLIK